MSPMRRLSAAALAIASFLVVGIASPSVPARAATAPAPLTPSQLSHRLTRDVYGYLPYWELDSTTDAYLRYDLLTTIALFSFSFGSDGTIGQPSSYARLTGPLGQSIVAHAHASGVRVELAFSFSQTLSVNDAFFNDAGAQAVAISQAVALVRQLGADGVNLDVEVLGNANFPLYGAFVKAMKAAIVAANPYGQVSVATNANTSGAWLAVQALGNGADRDFIMGYDYRTGGADPVGSISPLVSFNGGLDLTGTLAAYASRGVPMARVLLGLPYYGRTWPTVSSAPHAARNTSLVLPAGVTACSWNPGYPYFFPYAMGAVPAGTTIGYDTTEQASWFATYDSTAKTWCETYFDSPNSLSAKYALAVSRNLAGVGMWALGYDAGQSGYWEAIAARFGILRLAGTDRYGTAAAVSAASFQPGVRAAFVATGADFPDALAAGPAAAAYGGPVLLVAPQAIPGSTATELARLKPDRIFVLGSTGAVSASVAAGLARYAASGTVTRIEGPDRYATAAAISASTFAAGAPVAYVATGVQFADAVGGAAAGAARGGPVLLVSATGVPASTAQELARLRPASIVVLGGPSVVSDAIVSRLASFTTGSVTRLAGPDRYATAAAVSAATFGPGAPVAYIATGLDFPDGLAGASAAGIQSAPVLFVAGSWIPAPTVAELHRLRPGRIVVLGGTSVVSDSVVSALRDIVASS